MICYEHPLNERIRTLLKLEDLFKKIDFFSAKDSPMQHHASLITLFEILEITSRADIKTDLLQELERQKQLLETLRRNPDISESALDNVLDNIQTTFRSMLEISGKVGEHLRDNEWLMTIKQRTNIPGGVCEFDLPSYHYWLSLDPSLRRKDFNEWLAPLLPIRNAFGIVLYLLRSSGKTTQNVAHQGIFQQPGSDYFAHMLRVRVSEDFPCVPEISANKYALNIRFIPSQSGQRVKVYEKDVAFELTFCSL
ncbi:cell division protein ZapD [Nitrosomonas sp.]|uniref:cell division protein ZapD n=1 Tax=Nitrosomonas sp. TaxID=42353 RepID=UPI00284C7414|nr:cell division protein ZapD [Nitrosomonas sp.]MDR4514607.1 cell division protein ZapD [Nitrosomonas sp.]